MRPITSPRQTRRCALYATLEGDPMYAAHAHGRPPTRLQAQTPAVRVDRWTPQQPPTAWQSVTLRDGAKGPLRVEIRHRRV